jgi:hypothetical protein
VLTALLVAGDALAVAHAAAPTTVPDFLLLDQKGRAHQLSRLPGKAVVVFVTGNGCPLARQTVPALKELRERYFERGVTFWMLDANLQDDRASIAKEGEALDVDRIPILHDEAQVVARQLGVTHTGEALLIGLRDRRIVYRGPVDDRLVVGGQRPETQRAYLRDALEAFLGGRRIAEASVPATGCAVGFESARVVTYTADVAPVLARRCASCHASATGAKPPLLDFASARAAAPALRRVLRERSMPPAAPDPDVGAPLAEGSVLPAAEARTLARWLDAGAPRGPGDEVPLAKGVVGPGVTADRPERRYELRAASAEAITIPAGDGEAGRAFALLRFARAAVIHDFRPRADRRGSWFKYEALYPNGRRETLFSLPAGAGSWRLIYALAQPVRVPAGTLLLATGGFDNSLRNPANPAPTRRLTCVAPACDDLFLGVVGVTEEPPAASTASAR